MLSRMVIPLSTAYHMSRARLVLHEPKAPVMTTMMLLLLNLL